VSLLISDFSRRDGFRKTLVVKHLCDTTASDGPFFDKRLGERRDRSIGTFAVKLGIAPAGGEQRV
jgi:hypothetical protein